ncbi:hypothetical protein X777_03978 [Ooceraea biroi]|uniref:Uncharacterized protein n=1 Tax=Ooceraea biroi TaxID=2015173 RepID=A0A026WIK3_OOCBI|nr:hypothetical protein X777_03978 [Ooceraea biroi]
MLNENVTKREGAEKERVDVYFGSAVGSIIFSILRCIGASFAQDERTERKRRGVRGQGRHRIGGATGRGRKATIAAATAQAQRWGEIGVYALRAPDGGTACVPVALLSVAEVERSRRV